MPFPYLELTTTTNCPGVYDDDGTSDVESTISVQSFLGVVNRLPQPKRKGTIPPVLGFSGTDLVKCEKLLTNGNVCGREFTLGNICPNTKKHAP
jgi:hypothetical protein